MIVAISGFHAGVNANHRKGPKADGIEDIHNFFVALNITAAKQERPTAEQQKKNEHGKKRRQHINRVAEHIGRDISDHQVAEHTSAEAVEKATIKTPTGSILLFDAFEHSGKCESDNADKVEYRNERVKRSDVHFHDRNLLKNICDIRLKN